MGAAAIVPQLKLATIVRSSIKTKEKMPIYDAFGRILKKQRDGALLTLDGQRLPATAKVFDIVGNPAQLPSQEHGEAKTLDIIFFNKSCVSQKIGEIEIEADYTTLQDLHQCLKKNIEKVSSTKTTSITFLYKGSPIQDRERGNWLCSDFLPAITVVCRDMAGMLMNFDGEMVKLKVDAEAADAETAKDQETDFVKMVSMLKRKRASIAMNANNPNAPTSARGPVSVRNW